MQTINKLRPHQQKWDTLFSSEFQSFKEVLIVILETVSKLKLCRNQSIPNDCLWIYKAMSHHIYHRPLIGTLTLPEHPSSPPHFSGSCYLIFSFKCMFYRSSFVLLYFFFWPLCCLFLDIRILNTPLVSSLFLATKLSI